MSRKNYPPTALIRTDDVRVGDRVRSIDPNDFPGMEGHVLVVKPHYVTIVIDLLSLTNEQRFDVDALMHRSEDGTYHYAFFTGQYEVFGRKVQA